MLTALNLLVKAQAVSVCEWGNGTMNHLKAKGLITGVTKLSRMFGYLLNKARALVKQGAFKAKKVGGVWVCFAEDFVDYLYSIPPAKVEALLAPPAKGLDSK